MAKRQSSPCIEVASGGVGESGASSLATHQVTGKISKLMVLRTTETSLCPNTGAAAVLVVDGVLTAAGIITASGSSIQAEAQPGQWVIGIVHTFPLFNEIMCIRLGELSFRLDECDLVAATTAPATRTACVLPCQGVETRDWYAWNDTMPPKPDSFHVVGEVRVANPGVEVELVPRHPQGKSSKTLLLDLVLVQRPGMWPQIMTWKQARYDKVLVGSGYKNVEVYCGDDVIAKIRVDDVS
jgi:hypothetical protein